MKKTTLITDTSLCYGCFACEVACKQEHNLPEGFNWMNVHRVGPKKVDNKLKMSFHPMRCRHCSKPPCMDSCPVDAITQTQHGIVLISEEACIGCLKCIDACPFSAIEFNLQTGLVGKCNLCIDRITEGLLPACVYHCPTGALLFGCPNDIVYAKQQRVAEKQSDNVTY